jgi:hypothetical protein
MLIFTKSNPRREKPWITLLSALVLVLAANFAKAADEPAFSATALTEFEASLVRDGAASTATQPDLSNIELSFDARLDASVGGHMLLKREAGMELEVDEAYAHYQRAGAWPLTLSVGQRYMPFGNFETGLISDPLTLETAETRSRAIMLGWKKGGVSSSFYYGGDSDSADLPQYYGFQLALNQGEDWLSRNIGLSFISHIGAAAGVRDSLADPSRPNHAVPAAGLSGSIGNGRVRLVGEYIQALDRFAAADLGFTGTGAAPSAYHVELGWKTRAVSLPVNVSLGYQGSAEALALGLPQTRVLVGASTDVNKNTSLALEWAKDRDYATSVGGTGLSSNTYTMQLAIEF